MTSELQVGNNSEEGLAPYKKYITNFLRPKINKQSAPCFFLPHPLLTLLALQSSPENRLRFVTKGFRFVTPSVTLLMVGCAYYAIRKRCGLRNRSLFEGVDFSEGNPFTRSNHLITTFTAPIIHFSEKLSLRVSNPLLFKMRNEVARVRIPSLLQLSISQKNMNWF